MEFAHRKLNRSEEDQLMRMPVKAIGAYQPVFYPIYVFLRRNQKFVSVKAPLDYFTPESLKKFEEVEQFFVPKFVHTLEPFFSAARRLRKLLTKNTEPIHFETRNEVGLSKVKMGRAHYEIADQCFEIIASLWGDRARVEPFFAAALSWELCQSAPPELLDRARNQSISSLDQCVLFSGWSVWIALHMGFCDWRFINQLRNQAILHAMDPSIQLNGALGEIVALSHATLPPKKLLSLRSLIFSERKERAAQMIAKRLDRYQDGNPDVGLSSPSIYGQGGICEL